MRFLCIKAQFLVTQSKQRHRDTFESSSLEEQTCEDYKLLSDSQLSLIVYQKYFVARKIDHLYHQWDKENHVKAEIRASQQLQITWPREKKAWSALAVCSCPVQELCCCWWYFKSFDKLLCQLQETKTELFWKDLSRKSQKPFSLHISMLQRETRRLQS